MEILSLVDQVTLKIMMNVVLEFFFWMVLALLHPLLIDIHCILVHVLTDLSLETIERID